MVSLSYTCMDTLCHQTPERFKTHTTTTMLNLDTHENLIIARNRNTKGGYHMERPHTWFTNWFT